MCIYTYNIVYILLLLYVNKYLHRMYIPILFCIAIIFNNIFILDIVYDCDLIYGIVCNSIIEVGNRILTSLIITVILYIYSCANSVNLFVLNVIVGLVTSRTPHRIVFISIIFIVLLPYTCFIDGTK